MASIELNVTPREGTGKGVARKLRAAGRVPGILYGYGESGQGSTPVSVGSIDLRRALSTHAGKRVVLNLTFEGSDRRAVAILRDLQRHPVSHDMLHADFLAIDLHQPLEINVPVHPVGTPVGVKMDGGVLEWARREVTIRVLPTQIPDGIELDVSDLHVGQSFHVSDLAAQGFEVVDDPEQTICAVASSRLSIEPAVEVAVEGEVPAAPGEAGSESNG